MAKALRIIGLGVLAIDLLILGGHALAQSSTGSTASVQADGPRMFQRNCASCHMGPGVNFAGPMSRDLVEGREDDIKRIILEGGTNMPGFKYMLTPRQADTIIAFIKTLPEPPNSVSAEQPQPWGKSDE